MTDAQRHASSVTVLAPAKINLFLSVGPTDDRGYHSLRTVFQAVGIYDVVRISLAKDADSSVFFDAEGIPAKNTVTEALRLLRGVADTPPVKVEVSKRIPSAAGLGGGSSDAAALLRGMQRFLASPVSEQDLAGIATRVGADVPFFLVGGRARAEGVGEVLRPLPDTPPQWVVLAQPDVGCSTKEMFRKLDTLRFEWRGFPSDDSLYNDFERVAPCECLDLIERVRVHGAKSSGLSGSGSAVFGIFDSEHSASAASEKLVAEGTPWVKVARFLKRIECL